MSELDNIIKAYRTVGNPAAFSAPLTIYNHFNKSIPIRRIKEALEHVDSYTLHREYKQPQVFNPYYCYLRRSQFQMDLIDIAGLKNSNRNITFLLIIIDLFSRKIWILPLKRKTAKETREALQSWIILQNNEGAFPKTILSDSGKEFVNRLVKQLFEENNIRLDLATNINKASIVERANKSIQILIYKYLTDKGKTKYIDVLPDIVKTYNSRKHRTLEYLTPYEADQAENEVKVRSIHLRRFGKLNNKRKKSKPHFQIGHTVRIKTYGNKINNSRRAYVQQFKGELFKIRKINTRMPIPMYFLRSLNEEEDIEGGFYAEEMVRIRGDLFKIEKILKRKGKGRNRKVYVKWKYFDNRWNQWIKASDIQEV